MLNTGRTIMKQKRVWLLAAVMVIATTTLALASGGEHQADSGALLKDFLYRVFNFAVTFGILAYFLVKPIRKGMSGRREGIEKALAQAETVRAEAEAKFAEYDKKLTQATAEIDEIYAAIKQEGEMERDRIIAEAKVMATKIKQEAEKAADREVSKARTVLRQEASKMAIEIAEDILQKSFTKEDQDRLLDEYMKNVGELH